MNRVDFDKLALGKGYGYRIDFLDDDTTPLYVKTVSEASRVLREYYPNKKCSIVDISDKSIHQRMLDAGQPCTNDSGDLIVPVNVITAGIVKAWQYWTTVQRFGDKYQIPREFDSKL